MSVESVDERLRAAVRAAVAAGHLIQAEGWGVSARRPDDQWVEDGVDLVWEADPPIGGRSCLCPMACVILGEPVTGTQDPEKDAARKLGITERQVSNFVIGFDAAANLVAEGDFDQDEFYRLGQSYRDQVARGEVA